MPKWLISSVNSCCCVIMGHNLLLACLLLLHILHSSETDTTTKRSRTDGTIVFPDGVRRRVSGVGNCQSHFCEEVDNYPHAVIEKMIDRNAFLRSYLSADVGPEIEISDRSQFDEGSEQTLCDSRIEARYPRAGINTNNTKRIIVNTDGYKQLVMTEVCNTNSKCKFKENFPNDYEASCKQKYIRRRLVSLDEASTQEPFVDVYDIPCCCVCSIKKLTKK